MATKIKSGSWPAIGNSFVALEGKILILLSLGDHLLDCCALVSHQNENLLTVSKLQNGVIIATLISGKAKARLKNVGIDYG
jgi:hypothetical protein